jgi:hypothetical protein
VRTRALWMSSATASARDERKEINHRGLHVHFGAGRLGCGLVLPAIAESQVPFVILQPPFDEFKPLLEHPLSTPFVQVKSASTP